MDGLLQKIIALIEQNIAERPKHQRAIATTLLALLGINPKDDRYLKHTALYALAVLEEGLDGKKGQVTRTGKEIIVSFPTLEKAAAAAILFMKLTPEETASLARYLRSLIDLVADSLQHYLASNLNLAAEPRACATAGSSIAGYMAITSAVLSEYYEDFRLLTPVPLDLPALTALVIRYYRERGCEIREFAPNSLMAWNTEFAYFVSITIRDEDAWVSVTRQNNDRT